MLNLSLSIFALLLFATILINYQINRQVSPERIKNRKRIHTWWKISLVCIPVFYLGGWALFTLVFVLILWAALEITRIQDQAVHLLIGGLLLFFAIAYSLVLQYFSELNLLFYLLPLLILFAFLAFSDTPKLRSPLLILFCITSIESILLISQQSIQSGYDSGLVILSLFCIISLNDIFQYCCGSLLGKRQLAPIISPRKTIEGAAGGILLTALLASVLLPQAIKVTWFTAIYIGVILAVLGILGDLSISAVKRKANIKNSGSSMPGHGGLLDRIDSLTLAAPGFGLCISVFS